jgi:hypothetical protein
MSYDQQSLYKVIFQGQVFLTPVPGSSSIGLPDTKMNFVLETENA